ncbi:respiratory nitrate reductase subunit gamma [Desulfobacula sp.]
MIEAMRGIKIITSILFLIFAIAVEVHASAQCVECHEEMGADHAASVHKEILCLECHVQAAKEDHEQFVFAKVDCRQCHAPHDEKPVHDAHSRVACNACHIKGGIPTIDPESKRIVFGGMFRPGMALPPHQAIQSKRDEPCRNCHFQGNTLGASSMVLPPKSILCMPCHVATFSVNDKTTLVTLFIFLVGMVGLGMVWFSGSMDKRVLWTSEKTEPKIRFKPDALFPSKLFQALKMIFIEVFLLKRLFQQSKARWIIHSLIFFPFLFRFAFGLTALLCSLFLPDESVSAVMLDKNHALRALSFDITGLMILTGLLLAFVRKGKNSGGTIASLPEPGRGMSAMIALIVLVGFIIEGLRIAMTGWPGGAAWAFLGYGISLLFKDMTGLTDIYGIFWYAHAILTGIFIALIPFTRMSHIITAPIILIMNARSQEQGCCRK